MEDTPLYQLAQDIGMLTTFASQQRFKNLDSAFARSRTGLKGETMGGRRPAVNVLLDREGLFDFLMIFTPEEGSRKATASLMRLQSFLPVPEDITQLGAS